MKEPSETKNDLIFIIFFAFIAGTFFGIFEVLAEEYLWDPNPKEGAIRGFIGILLLVALFLSIAITLSKDLKRRVDRKVKIKKRALKHLRKAGFKE